MKRKVFLMSSMLLIAIMLEVPVEARTSQNLEWGVEVEDTYYYHLFRNMSGTISDEDILVNVTGLLDPIPDPLIEWQNLPVISTSYNASEVEMYDLLAVYPMSAIVPIGNWSLMTELVENVTVLALLHPIPYLYDIQPNVIVDNFLHWGFTYTFESLTNNDTVVTIRYLKSDGLIASIGIRVYGTGINATVNSYRRLDRDGREPSINSPSDIDYNIGEVGNEIIWSATDQSPAGYRIHKDDVMIKRGRWNSSSETIVVDVDGLTVGTYDYEIEFFEASGLSASDVVTVTVGEVANTTSTSETTTESSTEPTQPDWLDFITDNQLIIGGCIVVLIVIILVVRWKR